MRDLAGGGFIAQQRNAVLVGGTGTGKTHLAIAIARSCIRSGSRGRFYNVVDLVNRLETEARNARQGRLADHLILASGTPAALAAKVATSTIPIVLVTGGDPVALGLVASLNRPGANVTGSANLTGELAPKRLQLLRELIPNAAVFGVLADPAFPATQSIADLQAAARTLGLQLVVVNARTDSDLEMAFATFSQQRVGAVLVGLSSFYTRRTEQLAALAARHALPAVFPYREFALAGGLMSYGSSLRYAIAPSWHLYRAHSQRREAGRSAGPAGRKNRADHQPQDRQGARPYHPGNAVGDRRRGDPMKRREFIAGLGAAAVPVLLPVTAPAQQPDRPIIGFLNSQSPDILTDQLRALSARVRICRGRQHRDRISLGWRPLRPPAGDGR